MGATLLSLSGEAQAQPSAREAAEATDAENAAAEKLYKTGKAQFERGRFEAAAKSFTAAYRVSHRDWLLYHAYLAYRKAQRDDLARDALSQYLASSRYVAGRDRLQLLLDRLEAELGPSRPFPERQATVDREQLAKTSKPTTNDRDSSPHLAKRE